MSIASSPLEDCPASPNGVSSLASRQNRRIAPLPATGDPGRASVLLRHLLAGRAGTRIVSEDSMPVRVEFRTRLFIDDGLFLLDAAHAAIHMRCASRTGYWDLGKNRRRLEDIRRELLAAQAAQTGRRRSPQSGRRKNREKKILAAEIRAGLLWH